MPPHPTPTQPQDKEQYSKKKQAKRTYGFPAVGKYMVRTSTLRPIAEVAATTMTSL